MDRFFDVATGGDLQLQLQMAGADFLVLRQFGYRDPHHPGDPFIIPRDPATFRTDLASIPWFFGWLIPASAPICRPSWCTTRWCSIPANRRPMTARPSTGRRRTGSCGTRWAAWARRSYGAG